MNMTLPGLLPVRSILVTDDSRAQREYAVALCREHGVPQVIESEDGLAALALLESLPEPPQVALVDLEMPRMDGVELIQRMVNLPCPPALIVISGKPGSLISAVETMVLALGLPLLAALRKPLTADRLAEALARYHPATHPLIGARGELAPVGVAELAGAIARGELVPHYQPKRRLADGAVVGVEVLARWPRADKGDVPPSQFIPLAETHALIHELTLNLADQALRDVSRWHACGWPLSVAINLSPLLLSQPHFLTEATELINHYHVDPTRVIWEITETTLVEDMPAVLALLVRMRLKGFGLSIDDYGTGFSSMQQLSRIPFSELKIDRSFVHQAAHKPHLQAILASAIDLAHKLHLTAVAEGVEQADDLALLQRLGADAAQGYLLGAPMDADAFLTWLGRQPVPAGVT